MAIAKRTARTRTAQFTTGAKWLHWLVAFFMLSVIPVALSFSFLSPADRAEAIPVHMSIGLIVLFLTVLRLAWRRVSPPPSHPPRTPSWTKLGAHAGHFLLYALIFWQAALGLWMASASPVAIRFFNGFNVSALAPANPDLIETLRPLHAAGAWLFTAVLICHVLGALYHHFWLRDDVLIRMLPFSGLGQRIGDKTRIPAWRTPSVGNANWPNGRAHD
jgi:cytochrome b561